jgi:Flp pilus assembly pilin Flp
MRAALARFAADRRGATSMEYALIAVLIGVVIVVGMTALANSMQYWFTATSAGVKNAGR